jgi:hypothetical protein
MRRLVALYPRPWRDRYAVEFLELLSERPVTIRTWFDVLRGAFDAWVHPQLVRPAPDPDGRLPLRRRLATAAATLAGGVLLMGGALAMYAEPINASLGYKESTSGLLLMIGGLVLIGLAALGMAPNVDAKPGSKAATAMLVGGLAMVIPFPILLIGFYVFLVANVAFAVRLWQAGHRVGGALIAVTAIVMTGFNTEDERALLALPFAIAWVLVGLAGIRPAPASAITLVDRPAT